MMEYVKIMLNWLLWKTRKKIAADKDIDTDQGHNILYAHAYIT